MNRYEFVMLFDVENGNPNGDPDAGNMPRVDPETSMGIVTDVCLKRKIRNYVEVVQEGEAGYNILIKADEFLNSKFAKAYKECNLTPDKNKIKERENITIAKKYMCENYYDVRTFGAVMSTGQGEDKHTCGTVRGPIQMNFAKSVDPVLPQEITITRQAITSEKDFNEKGNPMGKKTFVPYGLYRAEGYVSGLLADKTGFSEGDLELFWQAITNMFEIDHSAARGKMAMRKLLIFQHSSALGNAPSHQLFDKIVVTRKPEVEVARHFTDYTITIDGQMPEGVTLIEKL